MWITVLVKLFLGLGLANFILSYVGLLVFSMSNLMSKDREIRQTIRFYMSIYLLISLVWFLIGAVLIGNNIVKCLTC